MIDIQKYSPTKDEKRALKDHQGEIGRNINQLYENVECVQQQSHGLELNIRKFLQEMNQYRSFYGSVR